MPAATPVGVPAATGICKPAWIETVRTSHIESLKFVPALDTSTVRVTPTGTATAQDTVEMIAYDRNFEVARASGRMGEELTLKIARLRPWTPDRPFTYEYRATVARGKQVMDSLFSLFAVRKVSLDRGENGAAVVCLNNASVFLAGVRDAGWWPAGGATAPCLEAIRRDIEKIKQLGFNTVHKAIRTDQAQWYFWADRLGVMVLQDLPSGDTPQLLRQYPRIIAELFNHPSVVAWVLPAGISVDAARQLTAAIRRTDSTRLVLGGPEGDLRQIGPAEVQTAGPSKQATLLAPLGDIQAPLPGHTWTDNAVSSPRNLTDDYLELAAKMAAWKTKAGLSGFIYKQLADAGNDHSGLIASDRQAIKLDLEKVALAKPHCFAVPQLTLVVPSGLPAPVASEKGPDVRIRREFTLDTAKLCEPWVILRREGDAEVFLNGAPVAKRRGACPDVELLRCGHGVVGQNILEARARAEAGKARLAVGLLDLAPQRDMRLPQDIKPLINTWMRDTCICLGPDGVYYMVGTGTTAPWKCDGIPLYKSADLKKWEFVKVVVWRDQFQGTWVLNGRKDVSIWAPELHYLKGNYWLTFCTSWARDGGVSGTGYLKSTTGKVEGPYELVNTGGPINPGHLDATFFQDDDGTVYFLDGGSSIARMKDDMSGLAEPMRRVGAEGGGTVGFEGISLFKRNGTYYLSVTDSRLPYKSYDCMVGMSNSVYGPYGKVHIAVPHGGHNVFFKDKEGNWWSTLFGGDVPEAAGPLDQQPSIVRIEFAPDGTVHPFDPRLR